MNTYENIDWMLNNIYEDANKLLAPIVYGRPQCGSKNYKEEDNNYNQTDDEMEYTEYYKCQDCGHRFVL